MNSTSVWTWWSDRGEVNVGLLARRPFEPDEPAVTVKDARDAQLLVAILDYLEAKAVAR